MFSIIIPCFDNGSLLEKTLTGIIMASKQANIPVEVILVDNNSSTDEIYRVYQKFIKKLTVKVLLQPQLSTNYSLCLARNEGIQLASHPWIVLLDSDIIVNPNYFTALQQALHSSPILACGERIFVDAVNLTCKDIETVPDSLAKLPRIASHSNYGCMEDRRMSFLKKLNHLTHPWAVMHGGNLIFSKHALHSPRPFNEAYDGYWGYEDIEFAYQMIQHGSKPQYIPGAFVYHQEPAESTALLTDRYDKKNNPNWKRICKTIPGFYEYKMKQYQSLNENISY